MEYETDRLALHLNKADVVLARCRREKELKSKLWIKLVDLHSNLRAVVTD